MSLALTAGWAPSRWLGQGQPHSQLHHNIRKYQGFAIQHNTIQDNTRVTQYSTRVRQDNTKIIQELYKVIQDLYKIIQELVRHFLFLSHITNIGIYWTDLYCTVLQEHTRHKQYKTIQYKTCNTRVIQYNTTPQSATLQHKKILGLYITTQYSTRVMQDNTRIIQDNTRIIKDNTRVIQDNTRVITR